MKPPDFGGDDIALLCALGCGLFGKMPLHLSPIIGFDSLAENRAVSLAGTSA